MIDLTPLWKFIWPYPEASSPTSLSEEVDRHSKDLRQIRDIDWSIETDLALEEARRIFLEEEGRKNSAQEKSNNILLASIALIPILTYIGGLNNHNNDFLFLDLIPLFFLIISIIYLIGSSFYSLRACSVSTYSRLYVSDLCEIWEKNKNIRGDVVAKTLEVTRHNQDNINKKISCFIFSQKLFFRGAVCFSLTVFFEIFFKFVSPIKILAFWSLL
tara:strand:+ start:2027 stop:2674 length:648 start_codon:yes stop_codon:yes gene_type:complete